ncbi:hypothetical protein X798_02189 [Onchocerca flexuosa]|uniref:Uncharacterized protein n=1 Tax=Onchocerca flexuosa TaxID=387005 RepID=A0A238C0W5_9BILA|nr:hypothetical protein X798_02189 [Onchocerca flexuosa]
MIIQDQDFTDYHVILTHHQRLKSSDFVESTDTFSFDIPIVPIDLSLLDCHRKPHPSRRLPQTSILSSLSTASSMPCRHHWFRLALSLLCINFAFSSNSEERYLWTSFIDIENSGKGRYVQCTHGAELHQTGLTVIVAIACVPLLSSIFTLSLNKIPRKGGTRYQRTDDPLQIFGSRFEPFLFISLYITSSKI